MADYIYTLTIPDARKAEMIEVFGKGWTAEIEDENGDLIPNPQNKAQFAAAFFDKFIKGAIHQRVMRHRRSVAPAIDETEIT